jgi:hypothetical protein
MAKSRTIPRTASKDADVVIKIDQRAFLAFIGLIGIVVIFFVGLWLGRSGAAPVQPVAQVQQQPLAVQQVQQPLSSQQVPAPVPGGPDPNIMRPASDQIPVGDNTRLALPELAETDYVFDFGDIPPDRPVETMFTIKNTGTRDLVIEKVSSS